MCYPKCVIQILQIIFCKIKKDTDAFTTTVPTKCT
jgi:hypothetical protein